VVEVLDGRSRRRVERYLRSLPERQREAIEVVSIDPYEAYRQAIHNELPWARIVVDHFYLVRGANTALNSVRRERQREAGRRKPKGARRSGKGAGWRQDLYRARHRLLKARERLAECDRRRLCALFEREPVIAEAWGLKEAFHSIYRSPNRAEAERRLDGFLALSSWHSSRPSPPSPTASGPGAPNSSPTSTSQPPTATPKASSTRSRSSSAAPTDYPPFDGFRERVLLACAQTGPLSATPLDRREPTFDRP
jgi:hypothetical protein